MGSRRRQSAAAAGPRQGSLVWRWRSEWGRNGQAPRLSSLLARRDANLPISSSIRSTPFPSSLHLLSILYRPSQADCLSPHGTLLIYFARSWVFCPLLPPYSYHSLASLVTPRADTPPPSRAIIPLPPSRSSLEGKEKEKGGTGITRRLSDVRKRKGARARQLLPSSHPSPHAKSSTSPLSPNTCRSTTRSSHSHHSYTPQPSRTTNLSSAFFPAMSTPRSQSPPSAPYLQTIISNVKYVLIGGLAAKQSGALEVAREAFVGANTGGLGR